MFSKLTDAQLERLAILSEELGEGQQAIGKIIRHGYESYNPDSPKPGWSNRHDLEKELGEILTAIEFMVSADDVSEMAIHNHGLEKRRKIKPYLHHQQSGE